MKKQDEDRSAAKSRPDGAVRSQRRPRGTKINSDLMTRQLARLDLSTKQLAHLAKLSVRTVQRMLAGQGPHEDSKIEQVIAAMEKRAEEAGWGEEFKGFRGKPEGTPCSSGEPRGPASPDPIEVYCQALVKALAALPAIEGLIPGVHSRRQVYVPRHLQQKGPVARTAEDDTPDKGKGDVPGSTAKKPVAAPAALPTRASRSELGVGLLGENKVIAGLCKEGTGTRLAILADAGLGKTTLLRQIAVRIAEQHPKKPDDPERYVPFLVDLKGWDGCANLFDRLVAGANALGHPLTADALEELCIAGRGVLLLDGLDEVPRDRLPEVTKRLNDNLSSQQLCKCAVVLAGRPWSFLGVGLRFSRLLTINPFSPPEIAGYISRYYALAKDTGRGRLLSKTVENSPELLRLACQPLLLAMLCCVARRRSPEGLPRTEADLLGQAMSTLLERRGLPESPTLQLLGRWAYKRTASSAGNDFTRDLLIADLRESLSSEVRKEFRADTVDGVLNRLLDESGLLARGLDGSIDFAYDSYRDYLAGRHLAYSREDAIQQAFAQYAWDLQWTRAFEFMAGVLWTTNQSLARNLVNWLVVETKEGRDDVLGSLALLAGRLCGAARDADTVGQELVEQVADSVFDAWRHACVLRDSQWMEYVLSSLRAMAFLTPQRVIRKLGNLTIEYIDGPSPEVNGESQCHYRVGDVNAIRALARIRHPECAKVLVDTCHRVNEPWSIIASMNEIPHALGEVGGRTATEILIRRLSSRDARHYMNRDAAAAALARIGGKQLFDRMIRLLGDPDSAAGAALALGYAANPQAVPSLAGLYISTQYSTVRDSVAEALGRIGDDKAVDALLAALDNCDKSDRHAVYSAIGDTGKRHAVEGLKRRLAGRTDTDEVEMAGTALGRIGGVDAFTEIIVAARRNRAWVASDCPVAEGLPYARDYGYEGDHEDWLDRIVANDPPRPVDLSSTAALIAALGDTDARIARLAALWLMRVGDASAGPALTRALEHQDRSLQVAAARALGVIGYASAAESLARMLEPQKRNDDLREVAAQSLGLLRAKNSVAALAKVLRSQRPHRDIKEGAWSVGHRWDIRTASAWALGQIGGPEAVNALRVGLDHTDDDVRWAALRALGKTGDKAALPLVQTVLDKYLPDERLKNEQWREALSKAKHNWESVPPPRPLIIRRGRRRPSRRVEDERERQSRCAIVADLVRTGGKSLIELLRAHPNVESVRKWVDQNLPMHVYPGLTLEVTFPHDGESASGGQLVKYQACQCVGLVVLQDGRVRLRKEMSLDQHVAPLS